MVYDRAHVTHPAHYTSHPSGIECIEVTEHLPFCLGNAIKYVWRAGLKTDNAAEDLAKAVWYLEREISRISQISEDEGKSYDPWSALRDFFGDDNDNDNDNDNDYSPVDWDRLRDEDDDEDDGFDGYECGAFDCDCDGSCFEMRDADEEDEDDEEDTYSDGRRRVTIAELRKRLNDDDSGDDPLQLLVTSILCHALTTNLVDALGDEDGD